MTSRANWVCSSYFVRRALNSCIRVTPRSSVSFTTRSCAHNTFCFQIIRIRHPSVRISLQEWIRNGKYLEKLLSVTRYEITQSFLMDLAWTGPKRFVLEDPPPPHKQVVLPLLLFCFCCIDISVKKKKKMLPTLHWDTTADHVVSSGHPSLMVIQFPQEVSINVNHLQELKLTDDKGNTLSHKPPHQRHRSLQGLQFLFSSTWNQLL